MAQKEIPVELVDEKEAGLIDALKTFNPTEWGLFLLRKAELKSVDGKFENFVSGIAIVENALWGQIHTFVKGEKELAEKEEREPISEYAEEINKKRKFLDNNEEIEDHQKKLELAYFKCRKIHEILEKRAPRNIMGKI